MYVMNHHSQATNLKLAPPPSERRELAVALAIQQYADSIVDRELATARARWAAHWEYSEEVDAVLEEMAAAIARDVLTARVRLAVNGELDGGSDPANRAQCDQIAMLFGLSTPDGDDDTPVDDVDQ